MVRFLFTLLLTGLPLLASAHEGHRHEAAAPFAAAIEANGTIREVVAAPSRCPGEETCCCHDLGCNSSFQPAVIAAAVERRVAPAPLGVAVPHSVPSAPRRLAAERHSPRGPPLLS